MFKWVTTHFPIDHEELSRNITDTSLPLHVSRRSISVGHPVDAPCRDMDSLVIDAEAVLPFSRGAKYMDNHPSAVPANARKKRNEGKERATGAPNAAKLITGRAYTPIKRDRGEVDSGNRAIPRLARSHVAESTDAWYR